MIHQYFHFFYLYSLDKEVNKPKKIKPFAVSFEYMNNNQVFLKNINQN